MNGERVADDQVKRKRLKWKKCGMDTLHSQLLVFALVVFLVTSPPISFVHM